MVKIPPLVAVDTDARTAKFIDAVPEGVDFIVVIPLSVPLALPDNLVGTCSLCGRAVQFRPENVTGPPKLCLSCVPDLVEGSKNPS